ncbi:MAG: hypothetical protein WCK00_03750 [Deltaproteobacteria bacterium]
MSTIFIKEEAHKIVDRMPASAILDDVMHQIYVREVIELGLADSNGGRTKDVKEIREKYGFPA